MGLTQTRGRDGEDIAVAFLQSKGYRILERNWRPGGGLRGEVDIIAWHHDSLVIVEVKAKSHAGGSPQESVTATKRQQLCRLANAYVSHRRMGECNCRFDVVEVWLPQPGQHPRVALHTNAFDYTEARPGHQRFR